MKPRHPKKDRAIAREAGRVLRIARELRGLSQVEAAGAVGIARTSLVKIENGVHAPTLDTFIHLCRALGLDAGVVLGRVEKELRRGQ